MRKEKTKIGWQKLATNPAIVSTLIMLLILGAALVAWQRSTRQEQVQKYFPGEINRFCLKNICLDNANNSWWLALDNKREPADNEAVNNIVAKFKNITLTNLVASNKNKFGEYGIGSEPVVLEINGKKLEIGKINASYDGIYVRPDNEDKIYDISQIIEKDKIETADFWRNKLVTNWPSMQFIKIQLSNGKNSKTYEYKDSKWDDPKLPETVAHLKEVGYLTDWKKDGSDEVITVNASTLGDNYSLTLGSKNGIYWATIDGTKFFAIGKDDYLLIQKNLR